MSLAYFAIAFAYVMFSLGMAALEIRRIRATGPDAITVFVVIFMLQCCLPGIGIYASLPLADSTDPTGNYVFDYIFSQVHVTAALLVLALTIWFAAFVYIGAFGGRLLFRRLYPQSTAAAFRIEGVGYRLVVIILGGLTLTLVSFYLMGGDMVERYANLIRLRAYSEEVERTGLNAYGTQLTQTWAWLSIPAIFVLYTGRKRGLVLCIFIIISALFALLGASRRAIFIPIVLSYLSVLLYDGKWRLRLIVGLAIPILAWVVFGKEIFSAIAFGGEFEDVAGRYESTASAVLRGSSEEGITIVESLGTITFLDDRLRLGVDHLLSIAQRFPHRQLGVEYPKRMVRISTDALAGPDAQDVPPGLLGQMWLDFRVLGPVIWGLLIGMQLSAAQFLFERCERSLQSSALVALLVFLIALPTNTGSYDFTFSVDVIATLVGLALSFRVRRVGVAS
jgi:hypothetical protein